MRIMFEEHPKKCTCTVCKARKCKVITEKEQEVREQPLTHRPFAALVPARKASR